jgi:hypothetical protein
MIKDLEMSANLTSTELSQLRGGMKWERGTENEDVIDARGESYPVGGFIIKFDSTGHFSGVIV